MKVFANVDIEFFDMADVRYRPEAEEEVIVILKDGDRSQCNSYRRRKVGPGQRLAYATYKKYISVPCKFKDTSSYLTNTYTLDEIICWGRLKKD